MDRNGEKGIRRGREMMKRGVAVAFQVQAVDWLLLCVTDQMHT